MVKVILKQHTIDNIKKIDKWMNDPELLFYDDDQPEPIERKSKEEIIRIMNRLIEAHPEAKKDIIHFGIHKADDNDLIGYCMIAFIDNYHRKCKLGLVIGEQEHWGKGYGKEALKHLVNYCFNNLKMNRIQAEVYSHNIRSIKLFTKLGFVLEGVLRESVLKNGEYVDEHIYALLKKY